MSSLQFTQDKREGQALFDEIIRYKVEAHKESDPLAAEVYKAYLDTIKDRGVLVGYYDAKGISNYLNFWRQIGPHWRQCGFYGCADAICYWVEGQPDTFLLTRNRTAEDLCNDLMTALGET